MSIPTLQTLHSIIGAAEPESLTLEFKRSDSLRNSDSVKTELSKDVSAMANSAGGRIIYGIEENNHVPQGLDQGSDDTQINREWLEQVINSRIHPKIEGLIITPIPSNIQGYTYYVLDIPQATSRAPHQAHDKRYYKRYNFQAVAMEDYEVRDTLRRTTTPVLKLKFHFGNHNLSTPIEFDAGQPRSQGILIYPVLINESVQPAAHTIVDIYFHPQMQVADDSIYGSLIVNLTNPVPRLMQRKQLTIASPPEMPVFKEASRGLTPIMFTIPETTRYQTQPYNYPFGYRVRCPGFDREQWGTINVCNGYLELEIEYSDATTP